MAWWIVELYLDKFNFLKRPDGSDDIDGFANLLFEFKQFLFEYKSHLDPATTFNLMASHGRMDEVLFYANMIEDYEKLVSFHIQREDYEGAIEVLRNSPFPKVKFLLPMSIF